MVARVARADSNCEKHIPCPLSKYNLDLARGVWGTQQGGLTEHLVFPHLSGETKPGLLIRDHRAERLLDVPRFLVNLQLVWA